MPLYNETVTLRRSRKHESNNNTIRSKYVSSTNKESTMNEQSMGQSKLGSNDNAVVDGSFFWIFEKFKRSSSKSSRSFKLQEGSPSFSILSSDNINSSIDSSSLNSIDKLKLVDSDGNNNKSGGFSGDDHSSLYILLSSKNEDTDLILNILNECINILADGLSNSNKTSYVIGSLIIHIKGLKKLYLQNLKKRKKKDGFEDIELEHWKLIIVSLKIFVFEYCNAFKSLKKVENAEIVKSNDNENNDDDDGDGDDEDEGDGDDEGDKDDGNEIPKYKMFRNLYRYENKDEINDNDEEFLNNLNIKLQNLQLSIL